MTCRSVDKPVDSSLSAIASDPAVFGAAVPVAAAHRLDHSVQNVDPMK